MHKDKNNKEKSVVLDTDKKFNGAIALITVLTVSGLLLISGITLVRSTYVFSQTSASILAYSNQQLKMQSCLEEVVQRLKYDNNIRGQVDFPINGQQCTTNITELNPTLVQISVSTGNEEITLTSDYQVDISDYPFVVSPL